MLTRALLPSLVGLALLATAPMAAAGTLEAPEITDAAGDCAFVPGNQYMDITAAWVSDETATDFIVNLAIPVWTEPIAVGAGFTVQFVHQGVQFGVIALYQGSALGGWYYGNARVDDTGVNEIVDSEGSFTAGSPNVLAVKFHKDHFPHTNAADNTVHSFYAGSVDLKPLMPFFLVPVQSPVPVNPVQDGIGCDDAEGGAATYTFTVGSHTGHDMANASDPAAENATADPTMSPTTNDVVPAAAADTGGKDTPGFEAAFLGIALLAALAVRRRG